MERLRPREMVRTPLQVRSMHFMCEIGLTEPCEDFDAGRIPQPDDCREIASCWGKWLPDVNRDRARVSEATDPPVGSSRIHEMATGTIGTPAWQATSKAPEWKASSPGMRVRVPSGNQARQLHPRGLR